MYKYKKGNPLMFWNNINKFLPKREEKFPGALVADPVLLSTEYLNKIKTDSQNEDSKIRYIHTTMLNNVVK